MPNLQSQMIQFGFDVLRDGAAEWFLLSEAHLSAFVLERFGIRTSFQTNMYTTRSLTTIGTAFTIHHSSAVRFVRVSCHVESKSCNPD